MTTDERLATLEANEKTIFNRLTKFEQTLEDVHIIASSVERIATENKIISDKVDKIDVRLNDIEKQPAQRAENIKRTVISCLITGVLSAIVGAVMAVIFK